MRTYEYDPQIYAKKITFTGVFCVAVLVVCAWRLLTGGNPVAWIGVGVIAGYTVWETFISLSNPSRVTVSKEEITFYAYGREHSYSWKDITSLRVKEFYGARKQFVRINKAGILRGRYWLNCYYFSDGEELYKLMTDKEDELHPNSLKAQAKRGGKPAPKSK